MRADRAAIDMKHIKRDFILKASVRVHWVDLGGGGGGGGEEGGDMAEIKLFQNVVMLHIKLKLATLAATW